MSNLNLETFNNILFGAFKEQTPEKKIELIEMELTIVADVMMDKVGTLLDELAESGYKSEVFTEITNIKNNTECLITELQELKAQIGESGDE